MADKAGRVTMLEAKLKATQGKLTKAIANSANELQLAKEGFKAKFDSSTKQYEHKIEKVPRRRHYFGFGALIL